MIDKIIVKIADAAIYILDNMWAYTTLIVVCTLFMVKAFS